MAFFLDCVGNIVNFCFAVVAIVVAVVTAVVAVLLLLLLLVKATAAIVF